MHHEPMISPEMLAHLEAIKNLTQPKFGPTGEFPGGKLTSTDEGQLAFGVTVFPSKVIVNFGKPIQSLGMSPEEARTFALALRRRANEIERLGRDAG